MTEGETLIKIRAMVVFSSLIYHTGENKNKSIQHNWCLFDNHLYAMFGRVEREIMKNRRRKWKG